MHFILCEDDISMEDFVHSVPVFVVSHSLCNSALSVCVHQILKVYNILLFTGGFDKEDSVKTI